jgi:hypothetical protein
MSEQQFWPFEVLPPERQTAAHREHIAFLEEAYAGGFRPFTEGINFGATAANGRGGWLLCRGSRRLDRWEVSVGSDGEDGFSFLFVPFAIAAQALLKWLRGESAATIEQYISPHVDRPENYRKTRKGLGGRTPAGSLLSGSASRLGRTRSGFSGRSAFSLGYTISFDSIDFESVCRGRPLIIGE